MDTASTNNARTATAFGRAIASVRFQLTQPLAWAVAAASLAPLLLLFAQWASGNLTANPIQAATIRTGKYALILLVISLACTPLGTLTGWRWVTKIKRATGLYGFTFVAIHLGIFIYDNGVLDGVIDVASVIGATFEKRFAMIGFVAFVLLVPLAVTSTKSWQKRLAKRWKSLHKLVYLIVPLAVLHFALLVKSISGRPEPLIWAAGVAVLLLLRITAVRKAVVNFRSRYIQKSAPVRHIK
jgi:methionine sulfoxide reductase heme-binding subunit